MPVFIYHVERDGRLIKGEIKARNLQIANIRLKARRLDPVYIKEKSLIPFFAGGSAINKKTVLFFTRQLSFLLGAGVSLVQALEMCISTNEDQNFKYVLQRLLKQLEAGKSLSKCLRSRPDVFDGFYVNMVVCAEETGLLDQILKELADYMEKAELLKSRVRSAMMYPAIVLAISISIITGIIYFVVPKFAALYANSGGLPALTQAFVNLSDLLRSHPFVLLFVLVGIPLFLWQYSKTEGGRKNMSAFLRAMPLFGKIQYQSAMVKFFRSFCSLLKAGVNFLDALSVAYNIADHVDIQRGIALSKDYVTKGKSFAKGLEDSKAFPPLVHHMAKIGEESGKMDESFLKLTVYYEDLLENMIAGLIKMIEPLMIVFLGGIIGAIILALYLPIFNIGELVSYMMDFTPFLLS